ncbi:DNA mismatch repair endonuclease MutL, partial [candidate division TA06 bacterium]
MAQIVILPDELVSKIAAGEVVERPASVVKELIENSLDAGAKRIVCEMENGGKRLIRVSDDGSGMTYEDALLATRRHATSKLTSSDDLLSIASFGFRGEALPSIASISKMEIVTRTKDDVAGTRVAVAGGEVKEATEAGCPVGTSVTVRDLFYNVPARRKFLRTTQTELYHVVNAVTSLALSSPEVAFSMTHDGHTLFEFPFSSSVKDRVLSVFGLGFVKSTLEVSSESPLARIYGFVSTPETLGSARTRQFIFVNKRPVSSRSLVHAVYEGFGLEGRTRHPAFLLLLEIDSGSVDV